MTNTDQDERAARILSEATERIFKEILRDKVDVETIWEIDENVTGRTWILTVSKKPEH